VLSPSFPSHDRNDEKIRSRAIDQIVKYTGNDIEKIEAKVEGNIVLNWGDDGDNTI